MTSLHATSLRLGLYEVHLTLVYLHLVSRKIRASAVAATADLRP
jgi:hypothetical protein